MRILKPTYRRTVTTLAAAAALITLAGCSTGGDDGSTGATAAPSTVPTTTVVAESDAPAAQHCGTARGPEGALNVNILADSAKVDCAQVLAIANQFGPKISMGQPATIDGWKCELPSVPGMLARCAKDKQRFGMFIIN